MKTRVQRRYAGKTSVSVRLCDAVRLRGVVVLAFLAGCGGAPFSATEFAQADGGTSSEAVAADHAAADQKTSSPEASREADDGHDAAHNDTDARPVPEEAGTDAGIDTGTAGTGGAGGSGGVGGAGEGGTGSVGGAGGMGGAGGTGGSGGSGGSGGTVSLPCDGAGLSTHHVGVDNLTWQDCVPVGTYNQAQATKACETWCATAGCGGCFSPGSICGSQYTTIGQVGISGPDVIMMGWSWKAPDAGNTIKIDPITQLSCPATGQWD